MFKKNGVNYYLRKLVASSDTQFAYARYKDLGIPIFDNENNLSNLQLQYLQWLELYASLYYDYASGEKYIDMEVIKSELRSDAYIYYRSKKREKENEDDKGKQLDINNKDNLNTTNIPSVIFTR